MSCPWRLVKHASRIYAVVKTTREEEGNYEDEVSLLAGSRSVRGSGIRRKLVEGGRPAQLKAARRFSNFVFRANQQISAGAISKRFTPT